jgi:uncharacterized protein YbjT (DUF2867 family)
MIVVTGATGRQGGAAVRHLLAQGWKVRGLTRKGASVRARALADQGVDVVQADMAEPGQLADALRGAYGVYSVQNPMISGFEGEVAQGRNVADAAKEADVQHVVYGSAGTGAQGTGVPSWESKLVVQDHMEKLGLPLTVLRPMAFMELLTDKGYYPPASTWHVMPKLMGDGRPVPWISVEDVGAVAALAFADPDRFIGKDLRLAADVATIDECRQLWREVTGGRPREWPMPVWLFERIVGPDLPVMWRWLRTGDVELDTAATRAILPSASGLRDWLVRTRAER